MKKAYTNPELFVVELTAEDVLTASLEQNLWQPGKNDIDWTDYLDVL